MLKVLVIDESKERAVEISAGLIASGYQVAAVLPDAYNLMDQVAQLKPDVILIDSDSPSRDTIEHLATLNRELPRPVLMFARDEDSETIRKAVKAGVSSYVVDSVSPHRLASIVEVALAGFEEFQALRKERDQANQKLSERVIVERAKGLLMKAKNLDEEAAYRALRKLAMDRGKKLVDVAQSIIDSASLLL